MTSDLQFTKHLAMIKLQKDIVTNRKLNCILPCCIFGTFFPDLVQVTKTLMMVIGVEENSEV